MWTVSPVELIVVLALCPVVAYRKKNTCMGLVQVLVVGLVLWFWNWSILSLDDHSEDVLAGQERREETRGTGNQVWNKPPTAEALV